MLILKDSEKFMAYNFQPNAIKWIKINWIRSYSKKLLNQSWAINIKLHLVIYIWIFLLIVDFVNAFVCWRGIFGNSLPKASHHTKHHVIWIVHENAFVKCQTTQWLVVVVEVKYGKLFVVARVVVYFWSLCHRIVMQIWIFVCADFFCIYAKRKKVEHFLEHTSRFSRIQWYLFWFEWKKCYGFHFLQNDLYFFVYYLDCLQAFFVNLIHYFNRI